MNTSKHKHTHFMAFFEFLCPKNNFIEELRKAFNMTPLLVPDNQTQPLKAVAHRGRQSQILGPIESLFEGTDYQIGLKPEMAEVANVSVNKTGSFNTDFGFKVLEGLFDGFGIKVDPIKAALSNAKEISLSFENVVRKSVPITTLGRELMNKRINKQNPAMHIFLRKEKPFNMYLISSVLQSNKILIHVEKKIDDSLELKAPVIGDLTDASIKLEEKAAKKNVIVFEGKEPLTFAFSAIELLVLPDGSLRFGEQKILKRSVQGGGEVKETVPKETSLIEEDAPALLAWNTKI